MAKIKLKRNLWAGFTNGHIDVIEVDTGWGGFGAGAFAKMPAIFASRKEAREKYRDVRQVAIDFVITTK